jgi:hypothetical protein
MTHEATCKRAKGCGLDPCPVSLDLACLEFEVRKATSRPLTKAEKLIWGLARTSGLQVWWCTAHPIYANKDGICPSCGKPGKRFEPEPRGPATACDFSARALDK